MTGRRLPPAERWWRRSFVGYDGCLRGAPCPPVVGRYLPWRPHHALCLIVFVHGPAAAGQHSS
jgi:hypothetical protein